jgi:hypothetical protein
VSGIAMLEECLRKERQVPMSNNENDNKEHEFV